MKVLLVMVQSLTTDRPVLGQGKFYKRDQSHDVPDSANLFTVPDRACQLEAAIRKRSGFYPFNEILCTCFSLLKVICTLYHLLQSRCAWSSP